MRRLVFVIGVLLGVILLTSNQSNAVCDAAYLEEFYNEIEAYSNRVTSALSDSLDSTSGGNLNDSSAALESAMAVQDDVYFLINQAALNGCISNAVRNRLKNAFSSVFKALRAADESLTKRASQATILKNLSNAGNKSRNLDTAIDKGSNVVTLQEDPPTTGFHNPGDQVHYLIRGLPDDCCATDCVDVSLQSSAFGLGYTPVEPTIIGEPCTGNFTVIMGEDQGGAAVVVRTDNGIQRSRLLYNYGGTGSINKADYEGHYIGSASGCVTAYTDEGPIEVCASADVEFDIDANGLGSLTAGSSDIGFGDGRFRLSSSGTTKFATGSISVAGATVRWSGSFMVTRDGVVGNGSWSVTIPGMADGGGTWSIRRL